MTGSAIKVGALAWVLAAQFFVAQAVVQSAWTTPFSLRENYISDLGKLKSHYPNWSLTKSLPTICEEIVAAQTEKAVGA